MPFPTPDYDIITPPWELPPHKAITFINATVVDPETSQATPGLTLRIAKGVVDTLGPGTAGDAAAASTAGDIVVDAAGLFICPGLIDSHVHLTVVPGCASIQDVSKLPEEVRLFRSTWVLKNQLRHGFTTVRDVGGGCKAHADATAKWLLPGPRVFQGGPILSVTGGHADMSAEAERYSPCCTGPAGNYAAVPQGMIVDGEQNALHIARHLMKKGADHIKICTTGGVASPHDSLDSIQFTLAEIKAITGVVRDMGRPAALVTAHCMTSKGIRHSLDGGVLGIEHGFFLDEPTAVLMAAKGAFLTPTLAIVEILSNLPFSKYFTPESLEKLAEVRKTGLNAMLIAEKAGVTVCYGTDMLGAMHPFCTNEFVTRSTVLPSATVLKHATVNPARMLGYEGKLGRLIPGAFADLILLSKNPLEDITILDTPAEHLRGVIKDGRCVRSRVGGLAVEVNIE